MKLLTIGDSLSQGFMSFAAARTDLSYSTLIAEHFNWGRGVYPDWPEGGLPLNLEDVLRRLNKNYGSDISGIIEWPSAFGKISAIIDQVERYYERGDGALNKPAINIMPTATLFGGVQYHNVASRGFTVADAWQLSAQDAYHKVENSPGLGNGLLSFPSESFYRTAVRVLNPNFDPASDNFTQLDWLEYHNQHSGGVENLFLWLGANNALGTALTLKVNQTSRDGDAFNGAQGSNQYDHFAREDKGWNLWHPDDFAVDYQTLLDKVHDIQTRTNIDPVTHQQTDWRVFIATIPLVTAAPIIRGFGTRENIDVDDYNPQTGQWEGRAPVSYGQYYTYFPFDLERAKTPGMHLNRLEVLHIDDCIRRYNSIIAQKITHLNNELIAGGDRRRYYIVDIAGAFNQMQVRRNRFNPTYEYPNFFKFIFPRLNPYYYDCDANGNLKNGGLFSLDGVHPSAIGQGLIAHEFLKVMRNAGVPMVTARPNAQLPNETFTNQEWKKIFDSDDLYCKPITLMQELYQHNDLLKWILEVIKNYAAKK